MPLFHPTCTLPTAWKKLYGLHAFEREEPWAAAKDLCFWERTSSSMDCAFDRNSGAPWVRNLRSVDCTLAPWNVLELHGLQFWQKVEFHGLYLSSMDCIWASWIVLFSCKVLRQNCIEAKLWSVSITKRKINPEPLSSQQPPISLQRIFWSNSYKQCVCKRNPFYPSSERTQLSLDLTLILTQALQRLFYPLGEIQCPLQSMNQVGVMSTVLLQIKRICKQTMLGTSRLLLLPQLLPSSVDVFLLWFFLSFLIVELLFSSIRIHPIIIPLGKNPLAVSQDSQSSIAWHSSHTHSEEYSIFLGLQIFFCVWWRFVPSLSLLLLSCIMFFFNHNNSHGFVQATARSNNPLLWIPSLSRREADGVEAQEAAPWKLKGAAAAAGEALLLVWWRRRQALLLSKTHLQFPSSSLCSTKLAASEPLWREWEQSCGGVEHPMKLSVSTMAPQMVRTKNSLSVSLSLSLSLFVSLCVSVSILLLILLLMQEAPSFWKHWQHTERIRGWWSCPATLGKRQQWQQGLILQWVSSWWH